MRKGTGILLAGLLMLSVSTSVYADRSVKTELPQESTDYYMTVDSGGIGVDIYPETSDKSEKLNNKTVEDGTVLHIEGETEKNGETWGYTEYNGTHGYVPLDELRPSTEDELKASAAGTGTDSTTKENAAESSTGTDSATEKDATGVSESEADSAAKNGETKASESGTDSTTKENAEGTSAADADSATEKDATGVSESDTDSTAKKDEAKPSETSTDSTENGNESGTSATDSTVKEDNENESDSTEQSTVKISSIPTQEGEDSDSKPVNGTAAKSFKEDRAWYGNPFVWIGAVTVLAVLGILGYHLRKH